MIDTISIDGAPRSIASASPGVMFGRFSISWKSAPAERLTAENLATKTVSGPIVRNTSRSDSSKPRSSDVTPTIEVMPMTTPRTVKNDRILFDRIVSHDIARISLKSAQRMRYSLLSASIGSSEAARMAG